MVQFHHCMVGILLHQPLGHFYFTHILPFLNSCILLILEFRNDVISHQQVESQKIIFLIRVFLMT